MKNASASESPYNNRPPAHLPRPDDSSDIIAGSLETPSAVDSSIRRRTICTPVENVEIHSIEMGTSENTPVECLPVENVEPASRSQSLWCAVANRARAVLQNRAACGTECAPRGNVRLRWNAALRRVATVDPKRRLEEWLLGCRWSHLPSASKQTIWLLGVCYCLSEPEGPLTSTDIYREFLSDFHSRIWITYRKGFEPIAGTKLTTDVGWGCMIRSGQMLLAQALIFHHLGRTWRRPPSQSFAEDYLEVLQCFGDSPSSPYSIHNIVASGGSYGLVAGSWLGPYAMCRSLEALVRSSQGRHSKVGAKFPMAVHVVSGDSNGERGGAPCVCIDTIAELCSNWNHAAGEWSALLLLIPLVLGLNKLNSRYQPLLATTFTYPQSLGVIGGKPGASTYLVGVQDDHMFYLDPHHVQHVYLVSVDNPEVDTSTYHCSNVKRMHVSAMDPSLALGFYCRNREDFEDLCERFVRLESEGNGAPMFSVIHSCKDMDKKLVQTRGAPSDGDLNSSEDGWQIL